NIKIIKAGFRRLYITETIDAPSRYAVLTEHGYAISRNKKVLESLSNTTDYKLGMYMNYIYPSDNYRDFKIGIFYYVLDGRRRIYLYGQKVPSLSNYTIKKISEQIGNVEDIEQK
ncbi:unnamed protein product, partial [Ascophyllum nodosum]